MFILSWPITAKLRTCILATKPRVQRKSFLKLAIRASWSYYFLAQTSFQLAPKKFWWAELISQFFCKLNSSKNFTCPLGKLRTEFTSLIVKSTSPGLWDTTFFARGNHKLISILSCGSVFLCLIDFFSCNTITFQKYFWCSWLSQFDCNNLWLLLVTKSLT